MFGNWTFLELASMVVTWWIMDILHSDCIIWFDELIVLFVLSQLFLYSLYCRETHTETNFHARTLISDRKIKCTVTRFKVKSGSRVADILF